MNQGSWSYAAATANSGQFIFRNMNAMSHFHTSMVLEASHGENKSLHDQCTFQEAITQEVQCRLSTGTQMPVNPDCRSLLAICVGQPLTFDQSISCREESSFLYVLGA